jgi:hypothetical protein
LQKRLKSSQPDPVESDGVRTIAAMQAAPKRQFPPRGMITNVDTKAQDSVTGQQQLPDKQVGVYVDSAGIDTMAPTELTESPVIAQKQLLDRQATGSIDTANSDTVAPIVVTEIAGDLVAQDLLPENQGAINVEIARIESMALTE